MNVNFFLQGSRPMNIIFGAGALALAFAMHSNKTSENVETLRDAALKAGYDQIKTKPTDYWNGNTTATYPGRFSMGAIFTLNIVEKGTNNERLCEYSGKTYHLFGKPLFSTGTATCTPSEP